MSRVLIVTLSLGSMFAGILGIIKAANTLSESPARAFLRATYCSPRPCWHAIEVGKTSVQQAKQILAADNQIVIKQAQSPDWDFCWVTAQFGNGCTGSKWLGIHPLSGTIQLADAILLFGYPTYATNCNQFGDLPSNIAYIKFRGGVVVKVYSLEQKATEVFSPDLVVDQILFSPDLEQPGDTDGPFKLFGPMGPHFACGEGPLD